MLILKYYIAMILELHEIKDYNQSPTTIIKELSLDVTWSDIVINFSNITAYKKFTRFIQ